MPLSLLANRPDVAIAEAKLAQSFYGIQAARGAFFPKITLSAQGTFTNSLGGMIMNPGKFIAAGVASLTQPLFAQGKLKGNYEIAKIAQESAQLDFEKTLLKAGQEVSNALNAYNTACQTTEIAQRQVVQLQKAYDDTEFLFKNGNTTTYLETLNAQISLLNGQLSLINNRYEKVQAVVALYQALGGGRQ
jgi:putative transport related, lipoprotein